MSKLTNWIRTIYLIIWALLFSQGPQFINQYLNHLEGHVQELRLQDNLLKSMMEEQDLRLLAQKMKESEGFYAVKQSEFILKLVDRKESFESAIVSLKTSSTLGLPFHFARYFDSSIGRETMDDFNFGIPATLDGLIYSAFGVIIGWVLWLAIASLFRRKKQPASEEIGV